MRSWVNGTIGLSHDICGVSATIQLEAEELMKSDDLRTKKRGRMINACVDKIVYICQSSREHTVLNEIAPQMGHENMYGLIQTATSIANARSSRRVSVSIDCCRSLMVTEHCRGLFRILYNLSANAISAILEHGGSHLRISVSNADGAFLDLEDDGPGLPRPVLDILLPSLLTQDEKEPARPLGLGLSIAISLARQIGGRLILLKTSTSGTKFRLKMPENLVGVAGSEISVELGHTDMLDGPLIAETVGGPGVEPHLAAAG